MQWSITSQDCLYSTELIRNGLAEIQVAQEAGIKRRYLKKKEQGKRLDFNS